MHPNESLSSSPAPLNPEGNSVNMDAADTVLVEANEIEKSSDPQVVRDVLEQLQSTHDALAPLSESLGGEVTKKCIALRHEIDRLQRLTRAYH